MRDHHPHCSELPLSVVHLRTKVKFLGNHTTMGEDHPYILHGEEVPFEVPPLTLGEVFYQRLTNSPPHETRFIEASTGRSVTTEEFLLLSVKTAEALKDLGIQRGDTVVIKAKQCIDYAVVVAATLFLGGTVLPPPTFFSVSDLERMVTKFRPTVIFSDCESSDMISDVIGKLDYDVSAICFGDSNNSCTFKKLEEFMKEDVDVKSFRPVPSEDTSKSVAFMIYSSGSTGLPKMIMLADRCLLYHTMIMEYTGSWVTTVRTLFLNHVSWITGVWSLINILRGFFIGILIHDLSPQKILDAIHRFKPAYVSSTWNRINSVINNPDFNKYDVSSVKVLIAGGCKLHKSTYDKLMSKWPSPVVLHNVYGMTEIGGLLTRKCSTADYGTVGILQPGTSLKVVNENGELCGPGESGELFFKSRERMIGFYEDEEATRSVMDEDGYFRTRDLGFYNKDGLVYIQGRSSEILKSDGEQVSSVEIEDVIGCVEGVADVAVVLIQVDLYRYHPMALVVRVKGSNVAEEDIITYVNENLPEFRRLHGGVYFVEELPMSPIGKLNRKELKSIALALYEKNGKAAYTTKLNQS